MSQRRLVAALLAVVLVVVQLAVVPVRAQSTCAQAMDLAIRDYLYASKAYNLMLYNYTYISDLNAALANISGISATVSGCSLALGALSRLSSVGPSMVSRARASFYSFIVEVSASSAAAIIVAIALDRWGRRLAWRLWLSSHARHVVKALREPREEELAGVGRPARHGRDPDSYVTYAVGLLILIAVGLVSALLFQLYWRPGPYSVIVLLGPQREIGGYPRSLAPGVNTTLYSVVSNHMNKLEMYQLRAYITYASVPLQDTASNYTESYTYYFVIYPGSSHVQPITFTAPTVPGQYKLVIFLYAYNITGFGYLGLYNQLYFNVTR